MGANSATAANVQGPQKPDLTCGECGSYSKLKEKRAKEPGYERDHVPAKATLREAAFARYKGKALEIGERDCIASKVEARGITVAIPKGCHRQFSPTCGSKNTKQQIADDAATPEALAAAVDRDLAAMPVHLDPECAKAYKEAAKLIKEHNNEKMIKEVIDECTGG
jgi:hypothetical protein